MVKLLKAKRISEKRPGTYINKKSKYIIHVVEETLNVPCVP